MTLVQQPKPSDTGMEKNIVQSKFGAIKFKKLYCTFRVYDLLQWHGVIYSSWEMSISEHF